LAATGVGDGEAAPLLTPHAEMARTKTIKAMPERKNPRDTAI
jgi:hypothetical protein